MRRLPIYFLIDCSESMVGENIKKTQEGMEMVVSELRNDPNALDSVYFSVIAFAGIAKQIAPLVEIASFYPPKLPIGSGTSLGLALKCLMDDLEKSIIKTTQQQKGDWKPVIYLFTDGKPTDEYELFISKWKSNYANKISLIAIATGPYSDVTVLKEITDNVLIFEETNESDYKRFFKWVTDSIKVQSTNVIENKDGIDLTNIDESILEIVKKPQKLSVDLDSVVIVGKCNESKNPYLMKYDRTGNSNINDSSMLEENYIITGCYPVDDEYFKWSSVTDSNLKVNTSELKGIPGCPYCGNICGFAMCGCGQITCVGGEAAIECPWCKKEVQFEVGPSREEGGFEVNRGRG